MRTKTALLAVVAAIGSLGLMPTAGASATYKHTRKVEAWAKGIGSAILRDVAYVRQDDLAIQTSLRKLTEDETTTGNVVDAECTQMGVFIGKVANNMYGNKARQAWVESPKNTFSLTIRLFFTYELTYARACATLFSGTHTLTTKAAAKQVKTAKTAHKYAVDYWHILSPTLAEAGIK